MARQLSHDEKLLVLEQTVVHFPVLALLGGATRRNRGLESLRMNRLYRKVSYDVADLTGIYVILDNLREHLVRMLAAVRTFEIAEFYDGNRRFLITECRCAVEGLENTFRIRPRGLSLACRQEQKGTCS